MIQDNHLKFSQEKFGVTLRLVDKRVTGKKKTTKKKEKLKKVV